MNSSEAKFADESLKTGSRKTGRKQRQSTVDRNLYTEFCIAFPVKIEVVYAQDPALAQKRLKKSSPHVLEQIGLVIEDNQVRKIQQDPRLEVKARPSSKLAKMSEIRKQLVTVILEQTKRLAQTAETLSARLKQQGFEITSPKQLLEAYKELLAEQAKAILPEKQAQVVEVRLQKNDVEGAYRQILNAMLEKLDLQPEQLKAAQKNINDRNYREVERLISEHDLRLSGFVGLLNELNQFVRNWQDVRNLQTDIHAPISQFVELYENYILKSVDMNTGKFSYEKFRDEFRNFVEIKLGDLASGTQISAVELLAKCEKILDKVAEKVRGFKNPQIAKLLKELVVEESVQDFARNMKNSSIVPLAEQLQEHARQKSAKSR